MTRGSGVLGGVWVPTAPRRSKTAPLRLHAAPSRACASGTTEVATRQRAGGRAPHSARRGATGRPQMSSRSITAAPASFSFRHRHAASCVCANEVKLALMPCTPPPPPPGRDRVSKCPATPERSSSRIYRSFAISAAADVAPPFDIHTHRTTRARGGVGGAVRAEPWGGPQHLAHLEHPVNQPEFPAQEKHGYRDPVPIPKTRRSTL